MADNAALVPKTGSPAAIHSDLRAVVRRSAPHLPKLLAIPVGTWQIMLVSETRAASPPDAEVSAQAERRALFGDSRALGFSFEWHDFEAQEPLNWAGSFPPDRLALCLNLDGQASVTDSRQTVELLPRASVLYFQGRPPLVAQRRGRDQHRFVTIEFAAKFLRRYFKTHSRHLHPCVQAALAEVASESLVGRPEPMSVGLLQLVESLRRCPVFEPAEEIWFRCKALEAAAQTFFCPPRGKCVCTRQQRAACERAGRVREILCRNLAQPPSLDELGRLVGCSPFYLSRQFSEATGLTIQQFLRKARLERAAELLRDGRHNVTEAALEVGYNSLSHFTVAFREVFGCCPGLYPLKHSSHAALTQTPGSGP